MNLDEFIKEHYLNEKISVTGVGSDYNKILLEEFTKYLLEYFKLNINIKIKLKKSMGKSFGYVDFNVALSKTPELVIEDGGVPILLNRLTHELTHIKQVINKELEYDKGKEVIIWKGKEVIFFKDYNSKMDYNKYKELPWEAEAINNSETLVKPFKITNYYKELSNKDETLKMLIDKDWLI